MDHRLKRLKASTAMRRRMATGVSTMMLVLGIGVFVIPPIGILVWEMNRYQFVQRQLEKLCDAASLAGATRMIEADTSGAPDANTAQTWRHLQGIEATKDFIEGIGDQQGSNNQAPFPNTIVSIPITPTNTVQVPPTGNLTPSPTKNTLVFKAYPSDSTNNYAPTPLGDARGTSISVSAYFTEEPAFAKFLGLGAVPVYASSTSATPRLDIMVALDCSGSMDDGSNVTFVTKLINITPQARANIDAIVWPPSNPDYTSQCGPNNPPGCGCPHDPLATSWTCVNQAYVNPGCAWNYYNNLMAQYNADMNTYNDENKKGQFLDYEINAQGELYNLMDPGQTTPNGFQINVVPQQHLSLMSQYIPNPTSQFLTFVGPGVAPSPCNSTINGFTDLVGNLGDFSNPQPDFGQSPFVSFSFADAKQGNQTFDFPNVPTLVEAQAGRLETPPQVSPPTLGGYRTYVQSFAAPGTALDGITYAQHFWQNTIAQPNMRGTRPPEAPGMKQAYFDAAINVYQPQATVIDAAKQFIKALQGAGKNIRLGIVAFDNQNAGMPPQYRSGTPTVGGNGAAELSIPPTAPDTVPAILPSVDCLPVSNKACIDFLMDEIDKIRPGRATDIFGALDVCRNTLLRDRSARASRQAIILITDGVASVGYQGILDPVTAIQSQWGPNNDIPVYCVGLAATNTVIVNRMSQQLTDGNTAPPINHQPAPGVASEAGNGSIYYQASAGAQLRLALLNIARRLVRLAA